MSNKLIRGEKAFLLTFQSFPLYLVNKQEGDKERQLKANNYKRVDDGNPILTEDQD